MENGSKKLRKRLRISDRLGDETGNEAGKSAFSPFSWLGERFSLHLQKFLMT